MLNYDIYMNIRKINSKFNIFKFCVPIIDLFAPLKYSPNRKYTNEDYLINLIEFLISGTKWIYYGGPINCPIKGKYLNEIHNKWCKLKVYDEINKALLGKYLSMGKEEKLKTQSLDSSFVANKQGSVKNNNHLLSKRAVKKNKEIKKHNKKCSRNERKKEESFIDFNRYNGRKRYIKISSVSDSKGTLSLEISRCDISIAG